MGVEITEVTYRPGRRGQTCDIVPDHPREDAGCQTGRPGPRLIVTFIDEDGNEDMEYACLVCLAKASKYGIK